MAKYRITSIPQGLDQFRKGGVKRDRKTGYWKAKKKNTNSIINYTPPSDSDTQDFIPQGYFDNTMGPSVGGTPMNDLARARLNRNQIQLAGNQRPLTPDEEVFQFNAGYDATADQVNDPLAFVCPQGQIDYMGKCISEEAYIKLSQEEMDRWEYNFDQSHKRRLQGTIDELNEKRMQNYQFQVAQAQEKFGEHIEDYYAKVSKSKKSDKVEPFNNVEVSSLTDLIPVKDENGQPIINPETGEPITETREDLLKKQFLIIKNDDGKADLYPLDIVGKKIVHNGFQAEQFQNIWGIDKKQVKEQLGPFLKAAKENYEGEVSQYIVKNALEKGKSAEEVIEGLSSRVGYQPELKKTFQKKTQKQIDDAYEEVKKSLLDSYDIIGQGDPTQPTPITDDMFASGEDLQTAWEKKYHPDPFDPYYTNKQKYIDEQTNTFNSLTNNKVSDDSGYALPKTSVISDRYADMDAQYEQDIKRNYDQELKPTFSSKEFNEAVGNYVSQMSSFGAKDILKDAFKSLESDPNLKSKFTNAILTGQGASAFDDLLSLKTKDDKGEERSYSSILQDQTNKTFQAAASHFGQNFMRDVPLSEIKPEITIGQKIQDVLANPIKSIEYFMDDRKQMWDPGDTKTFSEKRYLQKEKGLDYGIDESVFTPLNVASWMAAPELALNPIKIGTELAEYYNDDNLAKGVANQLIDVGTSLGLTKGLNTLMRGKPLSALGQLYSSPLVNYGMLANAIRPDGTFSQAKDYFNQGNIEDALKTAGWGALEVGPMATGLTKGVKNLLTTGEIPIPGRYGLQYSLPSGKSISLTPRGTENAFNTSAKQYFSTPQGSKEYRNLIQKYFFDPSARPGSKLYREPAEAALSNQITSNLITTANEGENFFGPQFTFSPSGLVNTEGTKSLLDFGKAGQLKLTGLQQPASLEYELLKSVGPNAFNLLNTKPVVKGYLPSGLPSGLNYKKGGALPKANNGLTVALRNLGNTAKTAYNDLSYGKNLLKYAWNSPALKFDPNVVEGLMPQSQALFNTVKDLSLNDLNQKILLKDYELSSNPYTGRFGSIDENRKQMFDAMMLNAGIEAPEPLVMTRRIDLNKPNLYNLTSGIYEPNRPLSFSAGRDSVGNKTFSGGKDRLVMSLNPGKYNILKNSYSPLNELELSEYEKFLLNLGYGPEEILNYRRSVNAIRSHERELMTPSNASFGELGRVKNNFGGIDVITEPIGIKYEKGGALPKKRFGGLTRFTGTGKSLPPAVLEGFNAAPNAMNMLSGLTGIVKTTPKIDQSIMNRISNIKPDSYTPIKYEGESYAPVNQEWVSVSPDDYNIINPETEAPMIDPNWMELGKDDANVSLNDYISKLPSYGSETFKGVGDFTFKDFSDGWEARNAMMRMADNPQDLIGKSDFFTETDLIKMVEEQNEWQKARNKYEEMYPFDIGDLFATSSENELEYDRLFSNLYPNVGLPNFRSKFILPHQEALLQENMPWQYFLQQKGMLDPVQLKNINKNENVLNTWREDINTPYKGSDAWKEISSQRGYKNKKGGVVTTLSKKEINKYVKDGYIVEEV
jgi:hypothetical protein